MRTVSFREGNHYNNPVECPWSLRDIGEIHSLKLTATPPLKIDARKIKCRKHPFGGKSIPKGKDHFPVINFQVQASFTSVKSTTTWHEHGSLGYMFKKHPRNLTYQKLPYLKGIHLFQAIILVFRGCKYICWKISCSKTITLTRSPAWYLWPLGTWLTEGSFERPKNGPLPARKKTYEKTDWKGRSFRKTQEFKKKQIYSYLTR